MGENKNLFLALGLSLLVMIGYDQLVLKPQMEEAQRQQALTAGQETVNENLVPSDDLAPATAQSGEFAAPDTPTYADAGQVRIETPELSGHLSLAGARFDSLSLVNHKISQDSDQNVQLLKPASDQNAYFVRFGWSAKNQPGDFIPGANTVWTADREVLTPQNPVTLSWTNPAGITFSMKIAVDDHFLFTVEQSVINTAGAEISVAPYALIDRRGTPKTDGIYILHEGPLGVFNETLEEKTYDDLEDDGNFEVSDVTGGWMGITDKFWMTTLIPDQNTTLSKASMTRKNGKFGLTHSVNYVQNWQPVAAGGTHSTTNHFFAGAKIVKAIDNYETALAIPLFDRTIDWGWFYFLTRPIFKGLLYFFELTGNFGVAILLLTVAVKLILFPLANKSYVSMSHMKKAQPKMKALQERYKDDKQKLQQEMMALYKKEKINPLAGCLPMLLQIPVFFALYKVLYVTIEMRHQPFVMWIKDLSAPDPLTPVNLFGLIPWDPPSFMAIGILPILMGVSMWATQKLSPQAASMDPTQQKVMGMLPFIFTIIMASFSAGLVLYWTWNSVLSIAQQWFIMRREDARVATTESKAQ